MAVGSPTPPTAEQKLAENNVEARSLSERISRQLGGTAANQVAANVPQAQASPAEQDGPNFDLLKNFYALDHAPADAPAAATAAATAAPTDFSGFLSFSNDDRSNSVVVAGNKQDGEIKQQLGGGFRRLRREDGH